MKQMYHLDCSRGKKLTGTKFSDTLEVFVWCYKCKNFRHVISFHPSKFICDTEVLIFNSLRGNFPLSSKTKINWFLVYQTRSVPEKCLTMVSTHGCQLSNFSWNRTYDQRFTESRTQPRMSECLRKEEVLQRVLKFIEAFSKKRQTPAWQTSNVNTWSSQVPLDASDTRTLHQWGWQLWRCPLASWQCQFLSPCQQQTSSQAFTFHSRTVQAQCCLPTVFKKELLHPLWLLILKWKLC